MNKIVSLILICFSTAAFLTAQQKQQGKRVLFIGDSVTDGNWGGSGRSLTDLNHIYGHGYMFLCASEYQAKYPEKDYAFFNRGVSGNTISDLKNRWQKDVLDLQPDILSILVGINDVNHAKELGALEVDTKSFEADYRQVIELALQQNPHLKLIIGEPFSAKVGERAKNWDFWNNNCRKLAEITKKLALEYGATYLPYQEMFDKLSNKGNSSAAYWMWDGVHPTAAGHWHMAQLWMKKIGKI